VSLFDETIAQFTALAVLLPIVAGQSGNTGAQALAVTSRGLALREIRIAHGARVLRKELVAAAVNGVASGGATAGAVWLWSGSPGLSFVIGVSMLVSMILAALSGALVPLVLTALGRDPATASSIILTTVTDVTGFFSFLGLARWTANAIGL
jgi:magnesium transporter